MNLPRDRSSGCYECHRDMYMATDAFRHEWHASPAGGRQACRECHDPALPRATATAKRCEACHKDLIPAGTPIRVKQYHAMGYVAAMHGLCIGCHAQLAKQDGKPEFARCAACHRERRNVIDASVPATPEAIGRGILLPPVTR
jgi:hypothetical protein